MRIWIEPASSSRLEYILENLSDMDLLELSATAQDPAHLAPSLVPLIMERGVAFVAGCERPITAFGLVPLCPGVAVAFAFSTQDYLRAIVPVTRFIRGYGTRIALKGGLHRIEFRALAARPDVERWVRLLGAKPEATLRCFGKNGEDFILYRWLRDEYAQSRIPARTARPVAVGNN